MITHSAERGQLQEEAIVNFAPKASPHDRNWILAEKFLRNELAAAHDPQEAQAAAVLQPWLESIWGRDQKTAVEILAHEIAPGLASRRVIPFAGGEAPARSAAQTA